MFTNENDVLVLPPKESVTVELSIRYHHDELRISSETTSKLDYVTQVE